ncbi:MAG: DNA-directed RNA polymerase [Candidatus Odinarchaeum yellowstonii]|jgi:DNA-directed RNA polymerase subunit E'|uniref:DNA-directed RNA polymerase subunit Rpo7 n=1 Tax=Odinarchaeota yellowstonii (strain LCB_4) TaxID=1841599 RepID=A0AAF0IAG3_ODILC|nr:MAG: DNA-directed RNA polymerase [Candidatus Odinarchaeum yellowstonii]
MYKLLTVRDNIRIPPSRFGEEIEKVSLEILREAYEGTMTTELGFIVAVIKILELGPGKIIPGDGATYHSVVFEALAFKPELQQIVEGEVVEVVDFGVFIRLGPLDGLCHVSQVTDDFISYDQKRSALLGKESGRILSVGDHVRARIIAVSLKGASRSGKIGLTMRQPYLGKIEWIKEDIKKLEVKEPKKTQSK